MKRTINVDHLARVEGHGGITVEIEDGRMSKVHFDIFEGARLLEALVKGRSYDELPQITSRICAICSVGHQLTSIFAVEDALGVTPTRQTMLLRDLQNQGENIESHALHLFCLVAPDFLGYAGAIELAQDKPELVKLGLGLKKLGNALQILTGGRAIHPINSLVGGYGRVPTVEELVELRRQLQHGLDDTRTMIDVFAGLTLPEYSATPTTYAALYNEGGYSLFGDTIGVSTGERMPISEYRSLTNEQPVAHSHAKHSQFNGDSFMVGSLARLVINGDKLEGPAREAMEKLGLELPCNNALANNAAQAVETVYSIDHAITLVNQLLDEGVTDEAPVPVEPKAGTGYGAVEVPRGTLYHSYSFDDEGRCTSADVITPTAQNLANAEKHFRATVENCQGDEDGDLAFKLEMVARAYDPCISCSVHLVERG